MITRLSLFRGIIALLIVTCIMSAVSAANTTNATYFSEITSKDKLSTTGFEAIQQNQTECPSPSITGRLLICRSNESVIAVYDRHGRKIFTAEDLKKGASENVLSQFSTHVNERVYGSNLVERAINGQFDQVKITFEQYLSYIETGCWDPPTPAGWAFIGDEEDTSMYWEPDDWSSESHSDYHAAVFFSHYGHRSGIQTTLDASGGQYIRIAVGPKGDNPLEIFLDDILIGNITDNFSIQQFDISSQSWTTTSILKIVAAGGSEEWGTGSLVENISLMASDSLSDPVSLFDGNPLFGNAPLNVSFTDTSTGSPTSWNWSFGDGGISTLQNPSHVYTMAGTYTVSLTATNAAGSNTTVRSGYVNVTAPAQTAFYVYAEGVGMYHSTQNDLSLGNQSPGLFYNLINGQCGSVDTEKCWYGRGIYLDDNAGSVHWSAAEQASSYADNADFSVFVGHGWNNGIVFGTQNSALELSRSNMQFGGNRAKWVTFFACDVLNQSSQSNWESVFNGVHIVNGFDTHGLLYDGQGTKYAQKLTGDGAEDRKPIRTAWRETLQETINKEYIKGAYMWANPCGSDYLPGFGDYCSAPTKGGQGDYDITWRNFNCTIS